MAHIRVHIELCAIGCWLFSSSVCDSANIMQADAILIIHCCVVRVKYYDFYTVRILFIAGVSLSNGTLKSKIALVTTGKIAVYRIHT